MNPALKQAPRVDRLEAAADPEAKARGDREGGRYGGGLVESVSLCSRGEALGHGMWIDDEMLKQIVDGAPIGPKLLKSRFTHPGLCSDGMGKALGTIENVRPDGDQVYGDLHFYQSAHNAPDGDLASYVMSLAKEDPTSFGLSIVFSHDRDAEREFAIANGAEFVQDDYYGEIMINFKSPDPLNVQNLPHARLFELMAADCVDSPAANPNGLFHRENAMLNEGSKLLDFVLGRSAETPALSALGVDVAPERLKTFVSKYLAKAGLSVGTAHPTKEGDMPPAKSKLAEDPQDEKEKPVDEKPAEEKPKDPPPKEETSAGSDEEKESTEEEEDKDKPASSDTEKSGLAKFCSAFGHERGAKYFLDGTSFEAAQTKEIAALRSERDEANKKLAAFANSGVEPVTFNAASDKGRDKSNMSAGSSGDEETDNRSKFAAAISAATK